MVGLFAAHDAEPVLARDGVGGAWRWCAPACESVHRAGHVSALPFQSAGRTGLSLAWPGRGEGPYAWAGGVVVGADAAAAVCSAGLPSGTRGAGCSAEALRTAVAYFSKRWNTRFTICVSAALAVTCRATPNERKRGY